jgi:hypothetical protein
VQVYKEEPFLCVCVILLYAANNYGSALFCMRGTGKRRRHLTWVSQQMRIFKKFSFSTGD